MIRRVRASFAAAAWAAALTTSLPAQSLRTVVTSRERTDESELNVSIDFAAGRFSLKPQAGRALFTQSLTYDEDKFTPRGGYQREGHALSLGLSTLNGHATTINSHTAQVLDLTLTPYVPMRLNLKLGAVSADLELGGLGIASALIETGASEGHVRFSAPNRMRCESLTMHAGAAEFTAEGLGNARCEQIELKGGVGDLTMDFGGAWDSAVETHARVELGLGALTLRLPRDLGVAIHVQKFLVSFDGAGMVQRGTTYYSRNYESADTKLDIDINAALGNIQVEWIGH
ncbi:MAG TPA: LiaF domain-containing protein [Gemmatimonadales bacterium]